MNSNIEDEMHRHDLALAKNTLPVGCTFIYGMSGSVAGDLKLVQLAYHYGHRFSNDEDAEVYRRVVDNVALGVDFETDADSQTWTAIAGDALDHMNALLKECGRVARWSNQGDLIVYPLTES